MRLFLLMLALGTTACGVRSNDQCVVYRDKCNNGCAWVCGSEREERRTTRGGTCDLGCFDSGDPPVDAECVAVAGECQWSEETETG